MASNVFLTGCVLIALLPYVEGLICTINASEPAYQPNIYVCNDTFICCQPYNSHACCASDVQFIQFTKQSLVFIGFGVLILILTIVTACYFNDPNVLDEEGNLKERNAKEDIRGIGAYVTKHDPYKYSADDPIFGKVLWDLPPKYANYDHDKHLKSRTEPKLGKIEEKQFEDGFF